MNRVTFFFVLIMGLTACAVYSQKNSDVIKIEFSSLSRGYNRQILITKDSLIETSNVNLSAELQSVKGKISSTSWEKLIQSIGTISFTEIGSLQSPTMKRTFDGARHSTITLTKSNGETASHSFDDEQPHKKLQKLMDEISKLAPKK